MRTLTLLLSICLFACKVSDGESGGEAGTLADSSAQAGHVQGGGTQAMPDTSDLGLPTKQTREAGKLYPVDEAPREPSLVAFRQNLLGVIQRRDVDALVAALSPTIKLGFSGESGRDKFRERWGLNSEPKTSDVWRVMYEVLQGGGVWQDDGKGGRSFSAPYVFATFNGTDAFTQSVIIGNGVNVRAKPSTSAAILSQLSYQVVDLPAAPTRDPAPTGAAPPTRIGTYDYGWTEVKLSDGRRGFVSDKFVYSPIGYRINIEREDGRWAVTNIASGD